jgi:hypothetical protein
MHTLSQIRYLNLRSQLISREYYGYHVFLYRWHKRATTCAVSALILASLSAPSLSAEAIPLTGWQIRYSPGMCTPGFAVCSPTTIPGGWYFTFPPQAAGTCPAPDTTPPYYNVSPCHHVDYVTRPYSTRITASTITATFSINAPPGTIFNHDTQPENTPTGPTTFRFLLEQRGDALLNEPTYRWWSNPISYSIAPTDGIATLSAPLDPAQWSDVYGQLGSADPTAFATTLREMGNIGFTFGGGYFFGHGVGTSAGGPATFILYSLILE